MKKSVVVTGCGTGIGRAIFDRLIQSDWAVVGIDMNADLANDARARCWQSWRRDRRRCGGG